MGATLLHRIIAYKCDDPDSRDTIYTLIVNTAEKNVHPISYHYWPINSGRQYEIMTTMCNMASDIFNGNLHWRGTWGKFGICSEFLNYAENVLKRAQKITGPVPELDEYRILYFKPDAPCADVLNRFAELKRFEINDFFDEKVLQIQYPTVSDLYWGQRIRQHYEACKKYAEKPGKLNTEKFRKCLAEWSYMMPDKYRELFKTGEQA